MVNYQETKYMTTKEVASRYGVETKDVLYAARRGLLKGRKVDWIWLFPIKSLPKVWPVRKRK